MTKEYLPYITPLRVFATFLVVVLHVAANYQSQLTDSISATQLNGYTIITKFTAGPLFIMISGALLLHPGKIITYKDIFCKYCIRILRAIVIFGLPMCFIESAMNPDYSIAQKIGYSFLNLVLGNCWTHMWYLYMLLGLYLLTPLFKAFIDHSNRRDLEYLLLSLFLLSYVLENLKFYVPDHFGSYICYPYYILLYPLGYYLRTYIPANTRAIRLSIIGLLFFIVVTCLKIHLGMTFIDGANTMRLIYAVSVFILFKTLNKPIEGLKSLDHCSFGIYLVHAVILNILFKAIRIHQYIQFNSWLNILIVSCMAFAISYAISYILRKIPYLEKKVL